MPSIRVRRLAQLGWLMFTLSGLFFLSDAIDSGDKTALLSAATWLAGVVLFLRAMSIENADLEDPHT